MKFVLGYNISIGDYIRYNGSRHTIEDKGDKGILTKSGIEIDYGTQIMGWQKGTDKKGSKGMNLTETLGF